LTPAVAALIGLVQGLCLPFRGFSRSGATISVGLMAGLPRRFAEEFSFALAVVLTPPLIVRQTWKLLKSPEAADAHLLDLLLPGLIGMGCRSCRADRAAVAVRGAGTRPLGVFRGLLPGLRRRRVRRSLLWVVIVLISGKKRCASANRSIESHDRLSKDLKSNNDRDNDQDNGHKAQPSPFEQRSG